MNPRTLLTASGFSPVSVSTALAGLNLEKIEIRPAPPWLTRVWGKPVSAMALPSTIYVWSDTLNNDPVALGPLIIHELVHVQQWAQLGVVRFLWRYLAGYLRGRLRGLSHRDAYRAIPLEIEAREITDQLLGSIGPA